MNNKAEKIATPEPGPKPRPRELLRTALTAAFMALGTPQALAQEQQEEASTNVTGSVTLESANTLPTNMIIDEDPTLQGTFRVDRVIDNYTAALGGFVNFDLRDGEFTNGEVSACIERVFGELFAKGCLQQNIDLHTFTATTQKAIGILAGEYGTAIVGDYNLGDEEHGQYLEAGREFSFSLGGRDFTITPMLGHEPQDNLDYGYITMTMPTGVADSTVAFRVYGNEEGRNDASIALSVPLGNRQ